MWIFTRHGFFSAVCARKGDGRHGQPIDPDRVMVRGRLRSHLEALKDRFPALLGDCKIHEDTGTDYAFRLFASKSTWMQVLSALGDEIDYDNFKGKVARHQGKEGIPYERALHDVWEAMRRLQK